MIIKRLFDVIFAILVGMAAFVPVCLISLLVKISSPGPAIHWSRRIGRDLRVFSMPKFRTMRVGTPVVATDLLEAPEEWVTPLGAFLRQYSLDELPQIWSIAKGDMSFVGPRPALFNQFELSRLREKYGVNSLRPGLTGWAQVNGRDELSIARKVELDVEYMSRASFCFDVKIILLTLCRAFTKSGISH